MRNGRILRWAAIGCGTLFAGLGLGGCGISQILPLLLLGGLAGVGT
jgi:hypothetical protein